MKYVYMAACIINAGLIGAAAAMGDLCLVSFSGFSLALCYLGYRINLGKSNGTG